MPKPIRSIKTVKNMIINGQCWRCCSLATLLSLIFISTTREKSYRIRCANECQTRVYQSEQSEQSEKVSTSCRCSLAETFDLANRIYFITPHGAHAGA